MISTTQELEDLIDNTVTIPTIPTVLMEINRIFASPDGSAQEAASVIEKDPAIAAKALRLVNSSIYGLSNKVASIQLACSILGLKVIKNIVVQATVVESFGTSVPGLESFDPGWLWDHSFKTAMAARLLVERTEIQSGMDKEDAYTSGLIHDVGKLLLLQSTPAQFGEAVLLSRAEGIPLAKAEAEEFGFSHAHVGGLLANRWQLPELVQAAVMYHHSPATEADDWARGFLIKAANTIAHRCAASDGPYAADMLDSDAMEALQINAETMEEIAEQVRGAQFSH